MNLSTRYNQLKKWQKLVVQFLLQFVYWIIFLLFMQLIDDDDQKKSIARMLGSACILAIISMSLKNWRLIKSMLRKSKI